MLVIHHLNNSRSQRILWLLEELGQDYRIESYERDKKTMLAPASLEKIHPLGKSPVVEDGDRIVAESGAIIEYLLDEYDDGSLKPPPGTEDALRFQYFLHYAEGSLMPPLLLKLVFDKLSSSSVPLPLRPFGAILGAGVKKSFINPNIRRHMKFLENELGARDWFAGNAFSAADIQMSFPLEAAEARGTINQKQPRLLDWLARIRARGAYQTAEEKGGPFDLLG